MTMSRRGSGHWLVGSLAVLACASGLTVGAQQEPSAAKPGDTPVKKAQDPSRHVPPYFGQIGLTQDQRESIYTIRAKHQAKLDELRKQITQVQAEMLTECEGVLTDTQKKLLDYTRTAAAERRKIAREAASKRPANPSTTPAASTPAAKPGEKTQD